MTLNMPHLVPPLVAEAIDAYEALQPTAALVKELYARADAGKIGYPDELVANLNEQYADILVTIVAALKANEKRHEVLQPHLCGECDYAEEE